MNRYSSYKDSAVEWIGEIPKHWKQIKLKHQYKIQKGRIPKNLYDEPKVGLIPYLSMDVLRGSNSYNFAELNDGVLVKKDEILILWDGSNSGEILKVEIDGILSSTMGVLNTVNCYLNKDFSFYQLKYNEAEIRNNTNGMGIPHVDGGYVRNLPVFVPPLQEQEQIVTYLDKKTAIVDALIASKEQKINLLKENRTALINQVITKGLDPNVKLKDSGVEWIGEIPAHWEVCKLKFITTKVTDGSHFSPTIENEGKHYISVTDVTKTNTIDFENSKKISNASFNELVKNGCRPNKGDILITKDGTIGRGVVVDDFNDFVILSSLGLIRLKQEYNPYYFLYYLLSGLNIDQMYSHIRGSGITRLTIKLINDLIIVAPKIEEQQILINYLDIHTQEIDKLISLELKKIETLKEYRQALISEVVTGKIKVVK